MREIKFRAWDKGENRWIDNMEFAIDPDNGKLLTASGDEMVWSNHSDYELTQYTGLLDKNGVEIYEGDIYKYDGGHVDEVKWLIGKAPANKLDGHSGFKLWSSAGTMYNDIEVIGNIYENPDLLKK